MTMAACNGGKSKGNRKSAKNTKGVTMETNNFVKMAAINVNEHVEKKNGMSYLSWPFAVDALMRLDPLASWVFHAPVNFGETVMVSCTVTAFGKPMSMHLPVMDHRNAAIKNPDAFAVNKAMMRCLVKAIAVHGLGLYIYAGEDLPDGFDYSDISTLDALKRRFADDYKSSADNESRMLACKSAYDKRKSELDAQQ